MLNFFHSIFEPLLQYFTLPNYSVVLRVLILLLVGIPLTILLSRWLQRASSVSLSAQQALLVRRITLACGFFIIIISIFHEAGFSLTPLLGAAGILSVALGFASQTSVSNIISGLFLMGEQPLTLGDVIKIGDITGEVLSIDLLSIKLRTLDNKFIRIPNETIIKSQVINITRFPIRRVDIPLKVSYRHDLGQVREILLQLTAEHELALADPEPIMVITGFGDSGIDLTLMVWTQKQNFMDLKNQLFERVKRRFDELGIEIPLPQQTVHWEQNCQPAPLA